MSAELKTIAQAYDLVKATGSQVTKERMAKRLREFADDLDGSAPPPPYDWRDRLLRPVTV